MFNGRSHKNKKGVYDAGMKKNTPISVQLKKDYDKLSKYDTDPKKARKAQDKEMAKKKKAKSNYAYGGMTTSKPRTGNTDYRMGGMFMKSGKK